MDQPGFFLTRLGGLGDVLMALAAVKALKLGTGARTALITAPAYRDLARACPHLDQVITSAPEAQAALADIRASAAVGRVRDLGSVQYGIQTQHQVDAYLAAFGLAAPAEAKSLELKLAGAPRAAAAALLASFPPVPSGRSRILLHPAVGDPNRSWPQAHWLTLARALVEAGHQVIRVGHGCADPTRGILELPVPGLREGANHLDALGFTALCEAADLLVSSDSGPVQLAGASEIAILGLYTVVPGSCRLPFRHGQLAWRAAAVEASCPHFPCFHLMLDPEVMAPLTAAVAEGQLTGADLFAQWCVLEEPYRCLQWEITPERVLEACRQLLG